MCPTLGRVCADGNADATCEPISNAVLGSAFARTNPQRYPQSVLWISFVEFVVFGAVAAIVLRREDLATGMGHVGGWLFRLRRSTTHAWHRSADSDKLAQQRAIVWRLLRRVGKPALLLGLLVVAGSCAAWFFKATILRWLLGPIAATWSIDSPSSTLGMPSLPLSHWLGLALIAGVALSLPASSYLSWRLLVHHGQSRQGRFGIPFAVSATSVFWTGIFLFRRDAWRFLQIWPPHQPPLPSEAASDFVSLAGRALLVGGPLLELPVIIVFLSVSGVVTHRRLLAFFRYFVLIAFAGAAAVTPPDPLSQVLLALLACILYAAAVCLAWMLIKVRALLAAA